MKNLELIVNVGMTTLCDDTCNYGKIEKDNILSDVGNKKRNKTS